jgi:peptidyl-prolyl cis-trans isomerase A (cyclophilin A)
MQLILCYKILLFILLVFGSSSRIQAQIYADITVSHGANAIGTFRVLLHHDKTPRTVANFIGLATGQKNWIDPLTGSLQIGRPFYDGLIFHRLIHNFMIQGGDPLGSGQGGPGYVFQDEFDPSLSHDDSYILSMANSGANSNGSQFFITLSAPTYLDNKHSIFGEVINDTVFPNSRALIDAFKNSATFPTGASDLPSTPITIDAITFSGPDYAGFDVNAPSHNLPLVSGESITLRHDSDIPKFDLQWSAQAKCDSPIYYSTDLVTWTLAGKLLSMDNNPSFELDITNLATTPTGFYKVTKIDYSTAAEAPQNALANGNTITLNSNGGSLNLTFDGNGAGTWSFIYTDTNVPTQTGTINSATQTNSSLYPIIPTTGAYINASQTYARFLSLRQITVFLEGSAGPDLLTVVQPLLSFNTDQTGTFDGLVNSSAATTPTFRGSFVFNEAP